MSDLLALDPSSLPAKSRTMPAPRFSFGAMLRNVLDSLVAAHGRNFENSEATFYRYPPI